jgi:hypothetical protein
VLNWVEENAERCEVIHGHEWGGAFVDLITANNFRQVCALPESAAYQAHHANTPHPHSADHCLD